MLFERHPWAATLAASRPPLGPGLMAKYDHELAALDGLGLDDVEMDACLTPARLRAGLRQAAADARAAQTDSAMSDQQWWNAHAPLLARIFDAEDYPLAARVGAAAGAAQGTACDPSQAYGFVPARTLDGLATWSIGRLDPTVHATRHPVSPPATNQGVPDGRYALQAAVPKQDPVWDGS